MRKIIPFLLSSFCFYLFVFPFCGPPVHAANGSNATTQTLNMDEKPIMSQSPIHITADRMEAQQDQRIIIFDNHVVVKQDDVTITSKTLRVFLLPEENKPAAGDTSQKRGGNEEKTVSPAQKKTALNDSPAAQKIDYIEFEGDVKFTQQDRLATAKKAIFYQKDQKVVLHGDPVVTKGQDRIKGDLITIYVKEGRSIVEGAVQSDIFPANKE